MIRILPIGIFLGVLAVLAACAGPEDRDDTDPTVTLAAQLASPTFSFTATATATEGQLATATQTSTAQPSPTSTLSPTPEPTPSPEPTATSTSVPIALEDSLPSETQLPIDGYFLANQGSRSALDLANSYADSSAHLERLDEWGFKEHLFREYSREPEGDEDPAPDFVLTTVNEYGGSDQATDVLDWLRLLNASQGHEFVDPSPQIGDGAIASSVRTSTGVDTAIVFVQLGPRIFAYFAQGGIPLEFSLTLANENTQRLLDIG